LLINKIYRTSAINGIIGFIEILSPINFSLHGTASMLGFLRQRGALFRFQPTTSFRPRFAAERSSSICRAVDGRHGRVLIHRYSPHTAKGVFLV